eukprot:Sspe_Gene.97823::Locus_71337_Transcript_1_1_Confidence_1.000_Length_1167::g.97823::m.97823/K15356/VRG4, GONST1; GDP-mannose transporter
MHLPPKSDEELGEGGRNAVSPPPPPPTLQTCLAIVLYATCSTSMILLNKLVTSKGINHPFLLIFLQNASGSVLGAYVKASGVADYPGLDCSTSRRWMPLCALFIVMLVTSILSLRTMSVAMYTLIKNSAMILTALGDVWLFNKHITTVQWMSFALMIMGSTWSLGSDRWVTLMGVVWTLANVFCTAGYNLYLKAALNDLKAAMGHWGLMFYNNTLSLPLLILPASLSAPAMWKELGETPLSTHIIVVLFMLAGAVTSIASLWCMRMTSPTTYTVIGASCKIPNLFLGIYIFDQYPTMQGWMGIAMAFGGVAIYTYTTVRAVAAASSPLGKVPEPCTPCAVKDMMAR